MPTIKNSKPVKPLLKKQPEVTIKPDSDPIRFEVGVTFENEEAKKHPYKYDPRAKATLVKASGAVIYTY